MRTKTVIGGVFFVLAGVALLAGLLLYSPLAPAAPDPDMFVRDGEGGIYRANQVWIDLGDGATYKDANTIARSVNGTIIIDIAEQHYLLQVPTTTFSELKRVRDTLEDDPRVESASYEAMPVLDSGM